jgi:hypothetical protein
VLTTEEFVDFAFEYLRGKVLSLITSQLSMFENGVGLV